MVKKKILWSFLFSICFMFVGAHMAFAAEPVIHEVTLTNGEYIATNDITYTLTDATEGGTNTATVKSFTAPTGFEGNLIIPDQVTYTSGEQTKTYIVTAIGNEAFSNCDDLTSVTIPDSVLTIGEQAFNVCRGLTSITIPDSVTSIGDSAFDSCTNLVSVNLGNGVETIGNNVFSSCMSLKTITIPASVKSIGTSLFIACTELTEINVDNGNQKFKSIDGVLFSKDETTLYCYPANKKDLSYAIPDTVTKVESMAFSYTQNLKIVSFGQNINELGSYAFMYSHLETIVFPKTDANYTYEKNIKWGIGPFCLALKPDNTGTQLLTRVFYHNGTTLEKILGLTGSYTDPKDGKKSTGQVFNDPNTKFSQDQILFIPYKIVEDSANFNKDIKTVQITALEKTDGSTVTLPTRMNCYDMGPGYSITSIGDDSSVSGLKLNEHNLENNVCSDCGYQTECFHKYDINNPELVAAPYGSNNMTIKFKCSLCQEYSDPIEVPETKDLAAAAATKKVILTRTTKDLTYATAPANFTGDTKMVPTPKAPEILTCDDFKEKSITLTFNPDTGKKIDNYQVTANNVVQTLDSTSKSCTITISDDEPVTYINVTCPYDANQDGNYSKSKDALCIFNKK